MFLLAEGRRFDTKNCQIVPKNATRLYIENRTFGDQITSPVILSKWKTTHGGNGIFRAKLEFFFEKNSLFSQSFLAGLLKNCKFKIFERILKQWGYLQPFARFFGEDRVICGYFYFILHITSGNFSTYFEVFIRKSLLLTQKGSKILFKMDLWKWWLTFPIIKLKLLSALKK